MPANADRFLVHAIASACGSQGIALSRHCGDWLLRLRRGDARRSVLGYHFDLNPDPAASIARDKAAAAVLLAEAGVPHVPHELVLAPAIAHFGDGRPVDEQVAAHGERFGWPLVVKPNAGTGGGGVERVSSPAAALAALARVFADHRAAAVSPLLAVEAEVRTLLLDGRPLLCFEKRPPAVVGDGRQRLHALIHDAGFSPEVTAAALAENADRPVAAGERVAVLWRHNLGGGAVPVDLDPAPHAALARSAADALGLRLCAVDAVLAADGWRVLEVNAGIMLERYARQDDAHRDRALAVYETLVAAMFA